MSRYPWDPEGPVGPQYPEGSGLFIWLAVLGLVALVMMMISGCLDSTTRVADSVEKHCLDTAHSNTQFHKCMIDSIWVLDTIEGNH